MTLSFQSLRRGHNPLLLVAAVTVVSVGACSPVPPTREVRARMPLGKARPAVIAAEEGERRFLRGGTAPLLIKIDPVTTGSTRFVLGSSDLPPGDAIAVHRHLKEDEIILITRGTARVQLGNRFYNAEAGGTVFIPQGTCISVQNVGSDTLSNVFIFSAPGFEQVLRAVSSPEGGPPKSISPADRAAIFHQGHAQAGPTDC